MPTTSLKTINPTTNHWRRCVSRPIHSDMSFKKAGPVRAVIIGLGATGFVFGVVAPWLPWGNLLPLWALLIFLAANGALVFIIVS